ncbi:uncharacterized protein TNCT_707441 [Trichonephila clavata]|uniref:SWIM-type domain-containing protein n=1 Tax=Trichonephila clavata TaxID=2740835 RepID=A0A8X6KKQ3_TRICU|nr:uncharacterized protein TNCT_707441 [Trichonephila clavata]
MEHGKIICKIDHQLGVGSAENSVEKPIPLKIFKYLNFKYERSYDVQLLGYISLSKGRSYTHEHLNQSGLYSLYVNREDSSVVRLQLRSRRTSSKVYNICIKTGTGYNSNIEWFCQCKVGGRVVSCCAHVASVLWYLGYWRHNHPQTKTRSLGYADALQDAATGWSSDDSASESEKETIEDICYK